MPTLARRISMLVLLTALAAAGAGHARVVELACPRRSEEEEAGKPTRRWCRATLDGFTEHVEDYKERDGVCPSRSSSGPCSTGSRRRRSSSTTTCRPPTHGPASATDPPTTCVITYTYADGPKPVTTTTRFTAKFTPCARGGLGSPKGCK